MSPSDIQIEVFGKTDVGLIREHNEDNLLVADLGGGFKESELDEPAVLSLSDRGVLFLVCDGMGGAAAGEVASQMAVDVVFDVLAAAQPQPRDGFARTLRRAVETANDRIFQQSRDNQNERGMGTTCTAAALNDDTLVVAQIGDSRCYVFRGGRLIQVTKDQSLAWQLIEAGAMTPEDAKAFEHANIILQALGVQERVDVVLSQVKLCRGDVMVLCSDGLHGPVVDQEIQAVLSAESDLKKAAEGLLQKALERDGPDNITVVLARFGGMSLVEPGQDDQLGFVGYDPGREPASQGGLGASANDRAWSRGSIEAGGTGAGSSSEDVAEGDFNRLTGSRQNPALEAAGQDQDGGANQKGRAASRKAQSPSARDPDFGPSPRNGKSVIALFFLALLAATAGGIFVLKCERNQALRSEATKP